MFSQERKPKNNKLPILLKCSGKNEKKMSGEIRLSTCENKVTSRAENLSAGPMARALLGWTHHYYLYPRSTLGKEFLYCYKGKSA